MDGDPSQEDRIRLIGRLFFTLLLRVTRDICDTYGNDGLVVIGTWLVAKSLLLSTYVFIHRSFMDFLVINQYCVTSLSCWGRVVIGSLLVYQVIGAGSNLVASTTVLTVSARPIGNGQKSCISFAWEGPREIGAFSNSLVFRAVLLYF